MSFRILNDKNDIIRVGWKDKDGVFHEESQWPTKKRAEEALCLLTEYAIGGALEERTGIRIVEMVDA